MFFHTDSKSDTVLACVGCNLCKPEEQGEKVRNLFTGNLSGTLEVPGGKHHYFCKPLGVF